MSTAQEAVRGILYNALPGHLFTPSGEPPDWFDSVAESIAVFIDRTAKAARTAGRIEGLTDAQKIVADHPETPMMALMHAVDLLRPSPPEQGCVTP